MIVTASRIFVIVAGLVAAGTFVFSLLSDYKRLNENDIRTWQKTIIYKIVTDAAPKTVHFGNIRKEYVTEAAANQQFDVPREELDDTVTRRILLELVADGVLILTDRDSYSVNMRKHETDRYETLMKGYGSTIEKMSIFTEKYRELVEESSRLYTLTLDSIRQKEINELQRAIIFEVILKAAPDAIDFEDIQATYVSKSAEYEEHKLPKDQLNSTVTRRVILGLIADNAIIQTASDEYSLNNLLALQATRLLEMTEAAKEDRLKFEANRIKFEKNRERQKKITELILELVGDKPGKYTEAELVRALMRTMTLQKAEAVIEVNVALSRRLLFFRPKAGKQVLYLGMDIPH